MPPSFTVNVVPVWLGIRLPSLNHSYSNVYDSKPGLNVAVSSVSPPLQVMLLPVISIVGDKSKFNWKIPGKSFNSAEGDCEVFVLTNIVASVAQGFSSILSSVDKFIAPSAHWLGAYTPGWVPYTLKGTVVTELLLVAKILPVNSVFGWSTYS